MAQTGRRLVLARQIPLSGRRGQGKYVLVDADYDGEYFAQFQWFLSPGGYVYRRAWDKPGTTVYLHRLVSRPPQGMWTWFKNGNKLDCRSANLGWQTASRSALARPQSSSGRGHRRYRGVYQNNSPTHSSPSWYAYCAKQYLGGFPDANSAAKAYDQAAKAKWGDKAILNFPPEKE